MGLGERDPAPNSHSTAEMGYLCVNNSADTRRQRKSSVLWESGTDETIWLERTWEWAGQSGEERTCQVERKARMEERFGDQQVDRSIWGTKKMSGERRRKAGCVARAQVGEVFDLGLFFWRTRKDFEQENHLNAFI